MNKKGLDAKVLVEFLLIVAGIIILFLVYKQITSGVKSGTDSEVCRESVLASTISKYPGLGNPLINLKCKTKSNALEGSKFNDELKKDIKNCEYQFWDGKLDFVSKWGEFFKENIVSCFICYIDTPKDDVKDEKGNIKYKKNEPYFVGVRFNKGFGGTIEQKFNKAREHYVTYPLKYLFHMVTLGKYKGSGEDVYFESFILDTSSLKEMCEDKEIVVSQ